MHIRTSLKRFVATLFAVSFSTAIAACSVEEQSAPAFTGPSEFALSVTLSATPDQLPRDGSSQSVVTVTVRDASGRAVAGQRLTVSASGATVSNSSVTTASDGQALFTVTAPPPGTGGIEVLVSVTPVGSDGAPVARTLAIALGGPNRTAPTFRTTKPFDVTPASPETGTAVRFDATATVDGDGEPLFGVWDEGVPCMDACTYAWNFGDGSTGSGRVVTHTYTAGRVYTVTLTVTDPAGATASAPSNVTVTAPAAPTVTLTSQPSPPLAGQLATLKATVTAVTGRSIVRYAWNFGDGTSQTTTVPTVTKTYLIQGTYVATVTATDDIGQTGSASLQLDIANSAVSATIVFSPTDPSAGQRVHFRAVNPVAPNGASIDSYEWNFGDSEESDGGTATGQSVDHTYTVGGDTYVVRLTITDSNGNEGVVRVEVEVE